MSSNQTMGWDALKKRISVIVTTLPVPVFLGTVQKRRSGGVLTLHGFESCGRDALRKAQESLHISGLTVELRYKQHSPSVFSRLRTLEGLATIAGREAIVFDPSEIFARSRATSDLVHGLREIAGPSISNVFCETWRRALYVVVKPDAPPAVVEGVARRCAAVMAGWQRLVPKAFRLSVSISRSLPASSRVCSVDGESLALFSLERWRLRLMRGLAAGALAAVVVMASGNTGFAQSVTPHQSNTTVVQKNSSVVEKSNQQIVVPTADDELTGSEPAVSDPNLTASGRASIDDDGDFWWGSGAKAALPLGHAFGTQIEGGFGDDDYYGVGGHLFWRDPAVGLVGAIGSYESYDGTDMIRAGAEADLYVDMLTLGGRAGYQTGDVEDGFFGSASASYYLSPDLAIRLGAETNPEIDILGRAGLEWRPAFTQVPGLSVFADSHFDDDGFDRVMMGMKLHFGTGATTLIDRDRRADPDDVIYNTQTLEEANKNDY